ncbi:MAG: hypothetical protein NC102_04535 [Clostridium sp.]|nr:hypothetical protein [Clostridium sp.]
MLDVPREITNGEDALMNLAYAFAMARPPKFTDSRVYNYVRNPSSLSRSTKRNLDYEYAYDRLRINAIPKDSLQENMLAITKYRLNGVLGCSLCDTEAIAQKKHPIFGVISSGMAQCGYRPSLFEWIAMNSKSRFAIKYFGLLRLALISLRYRISLLLKH